MTALRVPAFRRLFAAQIVSLAGTGLVTVSLGLLAYDVAGASAGRVLGTVFAIKMVAYVVVAPVAAALVMRLPRRQVMVGADVLCAAVALGLPFVGSLWQVYLLVFVLQAASAVHTPTFQSALPDVLPNEREYTQALSVSRIADDLEMVLSPVLAAALLVVVSGQTLFVGTAIGFAASAVLIASVALPRVTAPSEGNGFDELSFGARVRHGVALFVRTASLRPVLALNLAVAAAGAFVLVQTVVIVRDVFGWGNDLVALMLAVNGLGSMATAFTLPVVLRRLPERRVMLGGAVLLTFATALVPLALRLGAGAGALAALALLWLAVGAGWACTEVPIGRLVVRALPERDRPPAFAAQFSLSHACWLVTYPLAGWLGAADLDAAALVLALLAVLGTITAVRLWPRTSAYTATIPTPITPPRA